MSRIVALLSLLFISEAATARVDWKVERAYDGGGYELEFGLLVVVLILVGYLYIKFFGFTVCAECKSKVRGNANFCKECGFKLSR